MRKKWFYALAMVVLVIPALLFVGCGKTGTAKDVKNRTFYVKTAYKDMQVYQEAIDNNLRISFFDDYFKVEYGLENVGYYLGTYTAENDTVELTTTDAGGGFTLESIPTSIKFSHLKYSKSVLSIEFVDKGVVVRYTFELEEN